MGSFRATLNFAGKDYDCLYSSYTLTRNVDAKGLVSSGVLGGTLTMRVESTDDDAIIDAMVTSQFKPIDGLLTFKKANEDSKMKTVEWKEGYVVSFRESFDANDEKTATILFTISAKTLIMGSATHENRWAEH